MLWIDPKNPEARMILIDHIQLSDRYKCPPLVVGGVEGTALPGLMLHQLTFGVKTPESDKSKQDTHNHREFSHT